MEPERECKWNTRGHTKGVKEVDGQGGCGEARQGRRKGKVVRMLILG